MTTLLLEEAPARDWSAPREFSILRFDSARHAGEVADAVQEFLDSPLGMAFQRGSMKGVILRGRTKWEPVLYFSEGALTAARICGVSLPVPEGTTHIDPIHHPAFQVAGPRGSILPEGDMDEAEAASMRVMVIEDNEDTATMLASLITAWGFNAVVARTGKDAIRIASEFKPKVVLVDLGLPDQHGYQVAERLRRSTEPGAMRFIAVTGWSQVADQELSSRAGISHHLIKPVNTDALRSILEGYHESTLAGR